MGNGYVMRTAAWAVAGLALALAGSDASAAPVAISGNVSAQFGSISYGADYNAAGEPAYSDLDGSGAAGLTVSGAAGPLGGTATFEISEADGTLSTAEYMLYWFISPTMTLNVTGASIGTGSFTDPESGEEKMAFAGVDGFTGVLEDSHLPIGDNTASFAIEDVGMLALSLGLGALQLDVGLADACIPGCAATDAAQQTVFLGVSGAAGDLSYVAYVLSASGLDKASEETGSGSGVGLGIAYDLGALSLALDLANGDPGCIGDSCISESFSALSVSVVAGGIGVNAYSNTTKADDGTGSEIDVVTTSMDARYYVELAEGALVGPELTTQSVSTDGESVSASALAIGLYVSF